MIRRNVVAFIFLLIATGQSTAWAQNMQQAVIFKGDYASAGLNARQLLDELHPLEEKLIAIINGLKVGEYDGHEFGLEGNTEFTLFMYGDDAEILFKAIEPELRSARITRGGKAILRYGSPGSRQRIVEF